MLFQYTPLTPNHLRLITFLPHSTATHLSLSLHHQPNYTSPSTHYHVLSWTHASRSRKVKNKDGQTSITLAGRSFLIPDALFEALAELWRRRQSTASDPDADAEDEPQYFVDALCINRRDEREQASYERERGEIFSSADGVLVWMGDGWEEGPLRDVLMSGEGVSMSRLSEWVTAVGREGERFGDWVSVQGAKGVSLFARGVWWDVDMDADINSEGSEGREGKSGRL